MSEQDNANCLNRAWDAFVQRPHGARQNDDAVDPTIRDLHAMDRPQRPDPAFRRQLRRNLDRQAQFRAGQRLGDPGQSSADRAQPRDRGRLPWTPMTRGARAIDVIAVAALLALVGTALFWAVALRPADEEPTATIELAATSPATIGASPTTLPTEPTATTPGTSTSTPEPTATSTLQPAPTTAATAPATATKPPASVACLAIEPSFDGLLHPIADPTTRPDTTNAIPADAATTRDLETAFAGLAACLGDESQTQRRVAVLAAFEGTNVSRIDAFRIGQDIDAIAAGKAALADLLVLDDASAVATLAIDGEARYLVQFTVDPGSRTWYVASLSRLPSTAPTEPTAAIDVADGGASATEDSSGGNDDNSGSGSSDDDGGNDNGDSSDDSADDDSGQGRGRGRSDDDGDDD